MQIADSFTGMTSGHGIQANGNHVRSHMNTLQHGAGLYTIDEIQNGDVSDTEPNTQDPKIVPQVRELIADLINKCVDDATRRPIVPSSEVPDATATTSSINLPLPQDSKFAKENAATTSRLASTTNCQSTQDITDASTTSSTPSNDSELTVDITADSSISVTSDTSALNGQRASARLTESPSNASDGEISSGTNSGVATPSPLSQDGSDSDSGVSTMSTGTPSLSGSNDSTCAAMRLSDNSPTAEDDVDDFMEVRYGGRDLLDLGANLTATNSWDVQTTILPPMNLEMFWQNRSQYHRLGDFGQEEYKQLCCVLCDFQYPVPN